jgi:hypothetical protein
MDRRARAIFDFHFSKPPFSASKNPKTSFNRSGASSKSLILGIFTDGISVFRIFIFHFSKPPFSIGENDENPFFLSHSVAVKQPETSRFTTQQSSSVRGLKKKR